ncbi:MAG: tripartite tricarboxylate transporter TctB family protein [Nocardioides alkalitolerans]
MSSPPPSSTEPDAGTTGSGLHDKHGDLVAGVLFVGLGLAFAVPSLGYGLGTWGEMGAGMFPFVLGLGLVGLGAAIALGTVRGGESTPGLTRLPWRAIVCVTGAVVAFAYLIPVLGLIPTTVITVFVTCLASPTTTLVKAALATTGITVACYVVFVLALQLRLPLYWF